MSNRNIVKMIEEYCNTNSITLKKLSANWILKLTKNDYITNYQLDLKRSEK